MAGLRVQDPKVPPAQIWAVMCELTRESGSFSVPDVCARGRTLGRKALRTSIRHHVLAWLQAGHVVDIGEAPGRRRVAMRLFRVADPGAKVPELRDGRVWRHEDTLRRLWVVMRIMRRFTVRDLTLTASRPDAPIPEQQARDYVRALAAAGYLRTQQRREAGGFKGWSLQPSFNTGPLAPVPYRDGRVFDQNTKAVSSGRAA